MAKKSAKSDKQADSSTSNETLGNYLSRIRSVKGMTLREVEDATDKEVSNAYLSQLENNKIARPSPNILHTLASVYAISYEKLMEKAGYISTSAGSESSGKRHGRVATFANENLTEDEEEQLLEYLAFLRSRRGKGGST